MKKYQDINAETINRWVRNGWEWGKPITHEEYVNAVNGEWNVVLTPTKPVPQDWFGETKGKKILGLASGGGQQMPIFAALGMKCTVLDYSQEQLHSEQMVAEREGYDITILHGDMTELFPFEDEEFDLIFHPVSNCYIENPEPVYQECARVLKHGGLLLGGYDHVINYVIDETGTKLKFPLPFNPLKNQEYMDFMLERDYGIQFSHTLEENLGGQIKAGFVIEGFYEDTLSSGKLAEMNIPTFYAVKARKR